MEQVEILAGQAIYEIVTAFIFIQIVNMIIPALLKVTFILIF